MPADPPTGDGPRAHPNNPTLIANFRAPSLSNSFLRACLEPENDEIDMRNVALEDEEADDEDDSNRRAVISSMTFFAVF